MSWRDILSYKTFRVVRIRDTRLGLLHWGLLLMIFAYIFGHNFLQLKKYQKVHSPVGSIRTTLQLPEERFIEAVALFWRGHMRVLISRVRTMIAAA